MTKGEGEPEIFLLPKCLHQSQQGLPHHGQEPQYLSHHLMSPRCISRMLAQKFRVARTQTRHSRNACECPTWLPNPLCNNTRPGSNLLHSF